MLFACTALATTTLALTTSASAQVAVDDIKIQLFLERSGTLSENIVGSKKTYANTPLGEGDAGEPADAVVVTLIFSGAKNAVSSDKIARDVASITVTQAAKTGPKILLRRAYGGFRFGESGKIHKAFTLDNATCAPLEVDVKVGKTRKNVKVPFSCKEAES
jgi:hypothetical protein